MSKLRIKDAPLLQDVDGTEKIPTGGKGDYSVTVEQLKVFAQGGLPQQLQDHINDSENPHNVTKDQVGLGNVDNTSDVNKPISTLTQEALDLKADKIYVEEELNLKADQSYVESELNLKANSVEVEDSLSLKLDSSEKGEAGGLATLDSSGKVPRDELPPFVDLASTVPTFNTPNAGVDPVTGVADGAYFNVRSSSDESYVDEYQNVGGVPTPSGKSYPSAAAVQEIREDVVDLTKSTAHFHHTVAAMIADETLADGKIVATKGYHNIFDDGGAIYLISAAGTDYSIPLANGLHAVFRDSFDIRKFGIQDNVTLDQTEYFQRLVNYADTREYEIDFHNFKIMTPMLTQLGRGSISFKGMIFNEAHKLKNLFIANNKTVQLQQDTSPIIFLPITNPAEETFFELQNVIFDPYVADYNITAGRYDGNMHGFIAHPHMSSEILWSRSKTNFSFLFDNVKFKSAAISYNLTTTAIYAEQNIIRGCSGDYIGLFYNHFANRFESSDVHGLYRDDQHAAGRLLVTSLLHEEPETGAPNAINPVQKSQIIKNVSSIKKSTGLPHVAYKHHSVTNHTIDLIDVDSVVGEVFIYAPVTSKTTVINKLVSTGCNTIKPETYVKEWIVKDAVGFNYAAFRPSAKFDKVTFEDVVLTGALGTSGQGVSTVPELNLTRVTTSDATSGFVRNAGVTINTINMKDCKTLAGRAFECNWSVMNIDGFEFKDVGAANAFFLKGASSVAIINAVNMKNTLPAGSFSYHFMADAGASLTVNVRFSYFGVRPAISNATLNFELSTPNSASVTYDPPSLSASGAAGDSVSTTVTLTGARVGNNVSSAFNQYNAGIEISAAVSSANTVTVKFKNTTATPIDLSSGIITVKLI